MGATGTSGEMGAPRAQSCCRPVCHLPAEMGAGAGGAETWVRLHPGHSAGGVRALWLQGQAQEGGQLGMRVSALRDWPGRDQGQRAVSRQALASTGRAEPSEGEWDGVRARRGQHRDVWWGWSWGGEKHCPLPPWGVSHLPHCSESPYSRDPGRRLSRTRSYVGEPSFVKEAPSRRDSWVQRAGWAPHPSLSEPLSRETRLRDDAELRAWDLG